MHSVECGGDSSLYVIIWELIKDSLPAINPSFSLLAHFYRYHDLEKVLELKSSSSLFVNELPRNTCGQLLDINTCFYVRKWSIE